MEQLDIYKLRKNETSAEKKRRFSGNIYEQNKPLRCRVIQLIAIKDAKGTGLMLKKFNLRLHNYVV